MLLKELTDYLVGLLNRYEFGISRNPVFQVGPQHNHTEKTVKKILVTQHLNLRSIIYGIKNKTNLIICNFGLPSDTVFRIDETVQKHLLLLLQNRIMVLEMPLSWHFLKIGPINYIAQILSLNFEKYLIDKDNVHKGIIYTKKTGLPFDSILSNLHRTLNLECIQTYHSKELVNHILISTSHLLNSTTIMDAKSQGCDCIIGSNFSSFSLATMNFYGISFIYLPLFTILEPVIKRFSSTLSVEFPRIDIEFFPSEQYFQNHYRKQNH